MKNKKFENKLSKKSKDELKLLAKELGLIKFSTYNKSDLLKAILEVDENKIKKVLFPTFWGKYHNHVYGVISVAAFIVPFLPGEIIPTVKSKITELFFEVLGKNEITSESEHRALSVNENDLITMKKEDLVAVIGINVVEKSESEYNCEVVYEWRAILDSNSKKETQGSGRLFERKMKLAKPGYVEGFNEKVYFEVAGQEIEFSCRNNDGIWAYKAQGISLGVIPNKDILSFKF